MSGSPRRLQAFDGVSANELAKRWDVPSVETWQRIDSTNDRAMELARAGAPRWTVVLADEQLAGRGRHGGRWLSASGGGLWMSIVLGDADAYPQMTLAVGVAAAEAMEALVPEARVTIRWPNDLMVGEGKVGGILAEGAAGFLVVGIGVNLSMPPLGAAPLRSPAAALNGIANAPLSRIALAHRMLLRLRSRLDGTEPAREAIEALTRRDALLGRWVDTEQHGHGVAQGIDSDGCLVLERPDGTRVRTTAGRVASAPAGSLRGASLDDSPTSSSGR